MKNNGLRLEPLFFYVFLIIILSRKICTKGDNYEKILCFIYYNNNYYICRIWKYKQIFCK